MFGFFRKSTTTPTVTTNEESGPSNAQLRTPSPSATSAVGSRAQYIDRSSPLREQQGPPDTPSPQPGPSMDNDLGLISSPTALYELISSVPAKSLHDYTLKHLNPSAERGNQPIHTPSSITLTHLTSFFSSLTPPPKLHCVRYHKFYYDVENTDRSCLVAHDDESAEVERVGPGYETIWGCCGNTVEGDGDMGPPDGWCYEGKHTTDTKRARFRADSTPQDDKLTSCKRHKCFEPKKEPEDEYSSDASSGRRSRPRKRAAPSRKRGRRADDDGEQERELEEATSMAGPATSPPQAELEDDSVSISSKAQGKQPVVKKPRKKRAKTTQDEKAFKPEGTPSGDDDDMDVDESISVASKRKPRAKNSKAKPPKKKGVTADDESPSASGRMSPPKSVSSVSPTRPRAGSTKAPMKPKATVRKTKKLDEVVSSSVDGEL